jgi:hypothetical protein
VVDTGFAQHSVVFDFGTAVIAESMI